MRQHKSTINWKPALRLSFAGLAVASGLYIVGFLRDMPLSTQDISSTGLAAVVTISAKDSDGNLLATGSGFFVAPTVIATNVHVIQGASQLSVKRTNGDTFPIDSVRSYDTHRDLALLNCSQAKDVPMLTLADTSAVRIGDPVVAAGTPLGHEGSVSTGIVSAIRDEDDAHVFQVTAPISHGSSGGPLLNTHAEVIGVNSFTDSGGQNLNFAYSSEYLKDLLSKSSDAPVPSGVAADGAGGSLTGSDPHKDAILSLLAQPTYSGAEFARQVLGDSALELLDMDSGMAYFSIHKLVTGTASPDALAKASAMHFVTDSNQLHFATSTGDKWKIDGLSMRKGGGVVALFSTPVSNIRFPDGIVFRFRYKSVTYTLDSSEIQGFLENAVIYGGNIHADVSSYANVMGSERLINRGAFVTKPEEPSLRRLTTAISENARVGNEQEKIQALAAFVTDEIANDYGEAIQGAEILKGADSTLITRRGSSANKAVLLASLLEHTGDDYLIVYGPRNVWIAVPQAGFSDTNKAGFNWDGKSWTLVDVATPQFKIGVTTISPSPTPQALIFVQRPKGDGLIIDRQAGQALGYR